MCLPPESRYVDYYVTSITIQITYQEKENPNQRKWNICEWAEGGNE